MEYECDPNRTEAWHNESHTRLEDYHPRSERRMKWMRRVCHTGWGLFLFLSISAILFFIVSCAEKTIVQTCDPPPTVEEYYEQAENYVFKNYTSVTGNVTYIAPLEETTSLWLESQQAWRFRMVFTVQRTTHVENHVLPLQVELLNSGAWHIWRPSGMRMAMPIGCP